MTSAAIPDTVALVVAAGQGLRAGGGVPKQFRPLAGRPLLAHSVDALARHPRISRVHVVVAPGEEDRAADALGRSARPVGIGVGGPTRQDSVRLGLLQLHPAPDFVLVHDAARPIVPAGLVDRVLDALAGGDAGACPALPVVDSMRRGRTWLEGEVDRTDLWRAQTPQGFRFAALLAAHAAAAPGATDDTEILRSAGHAVRLVAGDERAAKVTATEDFAAMERWFEWHTMSGTGFDVHAFGPGDHVWLCGVKVPHARGLVGHSDADVGLHALTDAILGALGDGDIGVHFPPSDPRWKGASSDRFLAHAAGLVAAAGGRIVHCDVTLIAEAPRVGPHRPAMLARLGEILHHHSPRISVKATTTESLGFTGRREGIAAQAIATIRLPARELP